MATIWHNLIRRVAPTAQEREVSRLWRLAYDEPTSTNLLGPRIPIRFPHVFAAQFQSIFIREQYRFLSAASEPRIIDCGANLGLASIYWKRLFPTARITAFEADPIVADEAQRTLAACGYLDIELVPAAVAHYAGTARFHATGSDTGKITTVAAEATTTVSTVRLREVLDEPVAMLKIDIEGAEADVLIDCASQLKRVANLIVEYHSFPNCAQQLDVLLGALTKSGLRYHVLPEIVAARPLVSRPLFQRMDMALNVFAFRE